MKVRVTSECECVVILLWQVIKIRRSSKKEPKTKPKKAKPKKAWNWDFDSL